MSRSNDGTHSIQPPDQCFIIPLQYAELIVELSNAPQLSCAVCTRLGGSLARTEQSFLESTIVFLAC